MPANVD